MLIALLGGTGRTGVLVLDELLLRGHQLRVLVRAEGRVAEGGSVTTVVGDCRDRDTLLALMEGADAVVSALGPRGREQTLHRDTARALVATMPTANVTRFVGISGRAVAVPGDQRSASSAVAARIVRLVGGSVAHDKREEYAVFAGSDLDWTLARPPRLVDGDETAHVEHDAHRSTRWSKVVRADLATFLVDVVEHGWYVRRAPFVATAKR